MSDAGAHEMFHLASGGPAEIGWIMAYDYDALYRDTPQALGAPSKVFSGWFAARGEKWLRVLDVGCGQGRDALPVARAGHEVVGVDLSPSGIAALSRAAEAEGLAVTGVVADIEIYRPEGLFDVVLIDRTLHMLAAAPRHAVLARLLGHVAPGGHILIADEPRNISGLKAVIDLDPVTWTITKAQRGLLFARREGP